MFDERHFPYEYECAECGTTATVSHEDVQGVSSFLSTSTVTEAVECVMARQRGWWLQSDGGAVCSDCAGSFTLD